MSKSNKSVDIYHDIEDLKCDQLTNSEAIQSLSDSVLHMSSVLSHIQDFMNIGKKATFDESTETTSTDECAKYIIYINILSVVDDGFIGVERKQNSTKQLFLTGISENVKEYQIQSYLVDRDVTPTWITLF